MVPGTFPRILIVGSAVIAVLSGAPAAAQESGVSAACPERRIGRVIVQTGDVFSSDGADPKPITWAAALANVFHVRTKSSFVRSELLFREGDCLDSLRLAESQRLLAGYAFVRSAKITVEYDDRRNAVVRVVTRDEWSTSMDVGIAYDDGLRLEDLQVTERNFLGTGVRAQVKHVDRRERREEFYSLGSPRLFGRADASASYGRSSGGAFYGQRLSYPFVGEVGRFSATQSSFRSNDLVTYAGGADEAYSHIQVPTRREFAEVAAARRMGPAGRSTIIGVTLSQERWRVAGAPTFVTNSNFGNGTAAPSALPAPIAAQMMDGASTMVSVHAGTRRFRYVEIEGLDGVRDILNVDLGYNAGVTLAHGFAVAAPHGVAPITDTYGRVHASFGQQRGASFVYGSVTTQAGYSAAGWRDVVSSAELVGYGRATWLPNQTLFLRFSAGGGWNMQSPHQLTLGGREGVRSLRDDEIPGGQRFVAFLEDRVRIDWPDWSVLDLGMTFFADAGRTWAGGAPFGQDSPWFGSAGVGLRVGVPRGTHSVIRPDIVFPVGRGGQPIFRVAYEINAYADRFWIPKLGYRLPRLRGPESF